MSWIPKDIPDLMGRKEDMREEHFRRREQTSLSKGMGSREFMARLGVEYPIGARMWDILGGPWGQVVEIRQPREVGPEYADYEHEAKEFIPTC